MFKGYDFGSAEANRAAYNGSDTPPVYTLDKVTAPVSAYYGNNDWLVVPEVRIRIKLHYILNLRLLTLGCHQPYFGILADSKH